MVKISAKGCYALQIMADLALSKNEGFVSLKNISERRDIDTIKYLEQVVTLLLKAGFVQSLRGNNGGYKLSRPPKDYTVGEILRVTEGSLSPIHCLNTPINECTRKSK